MILDWPAFDRLTAGDRDLQFELLELFRAQKPLLVQEAGSSAPSILAHKLTGLAANLCAPDLGALAARWADLPTADRSALLSDALNELEDALSEAISGP